MLQPVFGIHAQMEAAHPISIRGVRVLGVLVLVLGALPPSPLFAESAEKKDADPQSILKTVLEKGESLLKSLQAQPGPRPTKTAVLGVRAGKPVGAARESDDPETASLQKDIEEGKKLADRLKTAAATSDDPQVRARLYRALSKVYSALAEVEETLEKKTELEQQSPAEK